MGIYQTETTLQLILDKGSLLSASKGIANGFKKSIGGIGESIKQGKSGTSSIYGYQGPGAGIGEAVGKISGGGVVAEESAGGKEKKGGKSVTGLLGVIALAVGAIAIIFTALEPIISPLFKILGLVILILFIPFLRLFLPLLRAGIPKLIEFAKMTSGFLSKLLDDFNLPAAFQKLAEGDVMGFFFEIFEGIQDVGKGIYDFIIENMPSWMATLSEWGQIVLDYISANLPSWIGTLVNLGEKIINFIVTNLPSWLQTLAEWGGKVLDYIGANLPAWLDTLKEWGVTVLEYINKNLPQWLSDLMELGSNLLTWVVETLPEILGKLLKIGVELLGWIITNLPDIMGKLLDIGATLFQWVWDNKWDMLKKLLDLGVTIFNEIGKVILAGFDVLSGLGQQIKDWIMGIAQGAVNWVSEQAANLQKMAENAFSGGGNNDAEVGDFISRPGGGIQRFSPQDTIIGMKDLSGLVGGGGGETTIDYSPTYNISAATDRDELRRIFDEHDEKVKRELQSALSYPTNLRG